MAEPMKVTIELADNPLAGLPGQVDFTVTISSDPDLELPDGKLPDPSTLSPALLAATEAIVHIVGLTHEAAFFHIAAGGQVGGAN